MTDANEPTGTRPDARGASRETDREDLHSLQTATREVMAAQTVEELAETIVEAASAITGMPFVSVHLHRSGRLAPIAVTDAVRSRFDGDGPVYGPGHPAWQAYDDERIVRAGDREDWGKPVGSGAIVPVEGHGVIQVGANAEGRLDPSDVELVKLLGANAAVALDRLDRERRFDRLHEATRKLTLATDTASVAATATDTAHEVLGLEINGIYLKVAAADRLVPVGVTAEARNLYPSGVPDMAPDDVGWEAFESGEPVVYDDIRSDHRVPNQTPLGSLLVLPLGDHGVFVAGAPTAGAFAEEDLGMARVFAANVEAALDSAERKGQLRRRETELERQNERLEKFASVVSHDLRNPLNVAAGQVELAAMESDDEAVTERLHEAEAAHERMSTLIDDLLSLARAGRSIGETESVDPVRLAREEWPEAAGELVVDSAVGSVAADPSRLRELVGNLLRNAREHGGSDVTVRIGALASEPGFYVADDGPGIPPAERESVFEHGYTTNEDGTGYGLTIVKDVAEAHGWAVRVVSSADGGARFEIATDPD